MEPLTLVVATFDQAETNAAIMRYTPVTRRFDTTIADSGTTDDTPELAHVTSPLWRA